MLENYQQIIWDWNGTLLDDLDLGVQIAQQMCAQHHPAPVTKEIYQATFGFPIPEYYRKIGIDLNKQSFEELTTFFVNNYDAQVHNCQLHSKVPALLKRLQQQGIQQYILTAAYLDNVLELLDHFNIRSYFQQVEGLQNHKAEGKVQRGVQMMKDQQLDAASTVLIGDTHHDDEVAAAMGIDCILVAGGHQSKERLVNNSRVETTVIDSLQEILPIL